LPRDARTVVDLGSHVGLSALYFAVRFPEARILAVEPNPALQQRLRNNTEQAERIEVVPVGVAGTSGTKRLKVAGVGDSWSAALHDQEGEEIVALTLADLLEQEGVYEIDVLKIDIEGSEFEVLKGADLERIGTITGELHPSEPDQLEELRSHLEPRFEVDIHPGGAPWWVLNARAKAGASQRSNL
jgi:FkbM family methyltransferase